MKDIIKQYTNDALRTECKINKVVLNPKFLLSVLTVATSAGVLLDQVKKRAFYGKEYNKEEMADAVHYIVAGLEGLTRELPNIYQESELDVDPRVFHAILGIATESTELLEALKLNGEEMDSVNILEELGDIMWYNSILVDSNNGDWEDILNTNIAKLRKRYPEKFTEVDATNRDLGSERKILEDGLS